jgi:glycerol uptake facilitator-like aquaporin
VERTMGQRLTAEFIGTATLIFIGAGAIIQFTALGQPANVLAVAFAHGIASPSWFLRSDTCPAHISTRP